MTLPATKRKKLKPEDHEESDDSDIDDVWNDMERIEEQSSTKHSKLIITANIELKYLIVIEKKTKKQSIIKR